ncbi:MAG: hypothetical protein ACREE4_19235 [Stellaceae bacterium]
MKKQALTPEQAFDAMAIYLQRYRDRTSGKSDLAALLGDIQINASDGRPFDPAAWGDWLAAIAETRARSRA